MEHSFELGFVAAPGTTETDSGIRKAQSAHPVGLGDLELVERSLQTAVVEKRHLDRGLGIERFGKQLGSARSARRAIPDLAGPAGLGLHVRPDSVLDGFEGGARVGACATREPAGEEGCRHGRGRRARVPEQGCWVRRVQELLSISVGAGHGPERYLPRQHLQAVRWGPEQRMGGLCLRA